VQNIVVQLVMGAVLGFAFGKGVVRLMREVQLANESLYPIMVLTSCIFIFSMTYFLKGNPYLAVYVGGLIIGNSKFTRKRQTKSFFDGLTWLSQLVMFLMLGLLVRPSELFHLQVLLPCFIISVVMIFISRPLAVLLCMAPFRQYNIKDKMMLSWVGLKGAVPIIFAIMCLAEGVEHADMLFNVVFLCTLVSLLVQGTTITRVARKLDLAVDPPQLKRLEHFDIDLPEEIESSATEIEVTDDMMLGGCRLRDLQIPSHTLVIMVRRGEDFFVPSGQSELQAGDQLLVITDNDVEMAYQYQQQMQAEDESQWNIQLLTNTKDFFRDLWKKITKN
jgi:cell volume regulation protein A